MKKNIHNRRLFGSVKYTARFHRQYMTVWLLGAAVPILSLNLAILFLSNKLWTLTLGEGGEATSMQRIFMAVIAVEAVTMLIGLFGLYILAMHRISGPYINLKNTFERIRAGDNNARLRFRDEDKLGDIPAAS